MPDDQKTGITVFTGGAASVNFPEAYSLKVAENGTLHVTSGDGKSIAVFAVGEWKRAHEESAKPQAEGRSGRGVLSG